MTLSTEFVKLKDGGSWKTFKNVKNATDKVQFSQTK